MGIDSDTQRRWNLEGLGYNLDAIHKGVQDYMIDNGREPKCLMLAEPPHEYVDLPETLFGIPVSTSIYLDPAEWFLSSYAGLRPPREYTPSLDDAPRVEVANDGTATIHWRPEEAESILDLAKGIVENKARDYGEPADNAQRVAELWDSYIRNRPDSRQGDITPDDVCMMMVLLKIARRVQTPKRDSLVDIAGWAAVADAADRND